MAKPRPSAPVHRADPGRDQPTPVPVRVRPGAGRDRVGGRYQGPHGAAPVAAVERRLAELRDGPP